MDQASELRRMAAGKRRQPYSYPFVMAVTSGKGGVGKSNVVANLGCSLGQLGLRVLVMDADMGLGNLDILLGLTPTYTVQHVLDGKRRAKEILVPGPGGMVILPASSGVQELTDLPSEQKMALVAELETLMTDVDVFLIDTGAGISSNVMYFNALAHEIMVVVTPEPTSITDAYALMKVSSLKFSIRRFKILLNSVKDREEAKQVFNHLSMVAQKFLDISLDNYGFIPMDPNVPKAVRVQKPVVEQFPRTQASKHFLQLALHVRDDMALFKGREEGGERMFWRGVVDAERLH